MEFAVKVTNLEKTYEVLQKKGVIFLCPPQTVKIPSGFCKYAYVAKPYNLYNSLVEVRF